MMDEARQDPIEKLMHEEANRAIEHALYIQNNPDCPSLKYRRVAESWHKAQAHTLWLEWNGQKHPPAPEKI